jgi:hypothetical protein
MGVHADSDEVQQRASIASLPRPTSLHRPDTESIHMREPVQFRAVLYIGDSPSILVSARRSIFDRKADDMVRSMSSLSDRAQSEKYISKSSADSETQ